MNETKIDHTISDGELLISGYSFVRKVRSRQGGGIAIYISKNINYNVCYNLMEETLEVLWIEISISHIGKVLICSVYRPDQNADYHEKLLDSFERAVNYNPNVLILGDFNINILNVNSNYFTDFMCSLLNLSQLVTEPNRVTTTSCTLIDHIYSSFSEAHRQSKVIKTCLSDD